MSSKTNQLQNTEATLLITYSSRQSRPNLMFA